MPRPTARDVHPSLAALTRISIAYSNNQFVYPDVFPIVQVEKKEDFYFVYDRASFFRNRSGPRAPGTEAPRGTYGISTASYICLNDSIAFDIPDEVRNNADAPLQPDVDATEYVSNQLELGLEIRVANVVTACGNWTSASNPTALWSNPSSSPFGDIMNGINAVVSTIGRKPNVAVCSWNVWRYLVDHPDFLERIKYTRPGARLESQDMRSWFELDKMVVGAAIKDTSEEGATAAPAYVWGNMFWIGYVAPNPSLRTPSSGYVFRWQNKSMDRFREELKYQDVISAQQFTAEKISASDAAAIYSTVV